MHYELLDHIFIENIYHEIFFENTQSKYNYSMQKNRCQIEFLECTV